METILGIKGPDFVMLAADCTQAHSIITLKEGKNRIKIILFMISCDTANVRFIT